MINYLSPISSTPPSPPPTCPVCNVELVNNQCSKCHREFYSIKQEHQAKLNYDVEAISVPDSSPILLCSEDNVHSRNSKLLIEKEREREVQYEKQEGVSYLRKHFPNAKITTREVNPS